MVRNAEACVDHLEARWGERFLARMSGLRDPMHDHVVVDLEVATGPFAGEPVTVWYYSTGEYERHPRFDDNYYYVLHHEEWERLAAEAAGEAVAGLPEGSALFRAAMRGGPMSEAETSAPVTEGGGTGNVSVIACRALAGPAGVDEGGVADALRGGLAARGLNAAFTIDVFDEEPEGVFDLEWALANRGHSDVHVSGSTMEEG